jgi:hypothetical protein
MFFVTFTHLPELIRNSLYYSTRRGHLLIFFNFFGSHASCLHVHSRVKLQAASPLLQEGCCEQRLILSRLHSLEFCSTKESRKNFRLKRYSWAMQLDHDQVPVDHDQVPAAVYVPAQDTWVSGVSLARSSQHIACHAQHCRYLFRLRVFACSCVRRSCF